MMLESIYFVLFVTHVTSMKLWEEQNNYCPQSCTCQLEHLTETAIYRFMQKDKNKETLTEPNSAEYNDVLYQNLESELLEDKTVVRSSICIIQQDTNTLDLLNKLPQDIESLTLIQGYHEGNKTIKFHYLENLEKLISLEILGSKIIHKQIGSHLICEINIPLPNLKYLNLENVKIKSSKNQIQNFVKEFSNEMVTFEYIQKHDAKAHPLTMIQKGINEEVIPYEKFKQQNDGNKMPLFTGFKNLLLLRIADCNLNNLNWAMFDGLHKLEYLLLIKNNFKFVPPFAFYGTPNLKTLSLAHNNLLDIQITDLAGLLELQYLDLSYNNFSQLSELSLPPFPKLKLGDFGNNPITVVFPNTFEVMNTTDSLIIGSDDVHLSLMKNSFLGLDLLKALTLRNLNLKLLQREQFVGMPKLEELVLTGNIKEIEYDTFLEVQKLKRLILNNCNIQNISMDAFIGLENLQILDLSKNQLEYLPPGIFDQLTSIKEIYLNNNKFKELPRDIFSKLHVKLIRLNENPWHCSCEMSEWKPLLVNRIKQRVIRQCDFTHDKGVGCPIEQHFAYKYIFDTKVAPKCSAPKQYLNWNVFRVMRRLLKCPEYKPKFRKHHKNRKVVHKVSGHETTTINYNNTLNHVESFNSNTDDNTLNPFHSIQTDNFQKDPKYSEKYLLKLQKYKLKQAYQGNGI